MTSILFCADPFNPSVTNEMWEEEFKVACNLGQCYLLDEMAFQENNIARAIRKLPKIDTSNRSLEPLIYHGWMMTPEKYKDFWSVLAGKGYGLINGPSEYKECHHINEWIVLLNNFTPNSIIIESTNINTIVKAIVDRFKGKSVIIKDFVKSKKHNWFDACFIPDSSNPIDVARVIVNFMKLSEDEGGINGGIVAREFIELNKIGTYSKSNMPISEEYRAFIYNRKIISYSQYWEEGDYPALEIPVDYLKDIIRRIHSNFFTIDIGIKTDGKPIVIEVGDGQVSSLPDKGDKVEFYTKLFNG